MISQQSPDESCLATSEEVNVIIGAVFVVCGGIFTFPLGMTVVFVFATVFEF